MRAPSTKPVFLSDREIAEIFKLSRSWVRQQRLKRRNGLPHVLTIDPIMIGGVPRYLEAQVLALIDTLVAANDNNAADKGDQA